MLEALADGVIGIDGDGMILFANRTAEKLLHFSKSDVVGRNVAEILWPEGESSNWSTHPLATVPEEADSLCRDSDKLRRRDGTLFPVSYAASRMSFGVTNQAGWVLVFQDVTGRKKNKNALIRTARYDTLTGLANRTMFQENLGKAISRADRGHRQLALFLINLDGFKEVNDSIGHHAGDELLQLIAERLGENLRSGDLVCRVGGDEFALIVEDSHTTQLEPIVQKSLSIIAMPCTLLGKHEVQVSASIGIACYPQNGRNIEGLVEKAEKAMYEVKKKGKNGYEFA